MKKFRWFTLIESLTVIAIIGIMTTAIYNMRNVGKDYTNYKKEAVSTIYKEIEQYLKDIQRNKVWTDKDNIAHESSSFQIKFTNKQWSLWSLQIWNTYLYCTDRLDPNKTVDCFDFKTNNANPYANWTWFFDSKMLITDTEYTAPKKIKDINKFKFMAYWWTWKNWDITTIINILPNWDIQEWDDYISQFNDSIGKLVNYVAGSSSPFNQSNPSARCKGERQKCQESMQRDDNTNWAEKLRCCISTVIPFSVWDPANTCTSLDYQLCIGNNPQAAMYMQLNICLDKHWYTNRCEKFLSGTETNEITIDNWESENEEKTYSFYILANENGEKCRHGDAPVEAVLNNLNQKEVWRTPIWKITINTITKKATLQRCNEWWWVPCPRLCQKWW